MRFSPRLPNDTATLLLGSTFIIVLVGLANGAHDRASHHIKTISIVSAAAILVVYLVWLTGYLRSGKRAAGSDKTATGSDKPATHSDKPATGSAKPATRSDGSAGEATSGEPAKPRIPIVPAIGLLATAGVASAFVSDWFVSALEPTINTLDISQAFAGLVIVAIAGNAVENTAGIVLAHKGDSELAISIVKNSVAQIAAFLYPLLVIVSVATATTLTFSLAPVYAGALFGTAVIVWQISGDGEANAFEGSALIAAFVILSVVAWFEA
jgi:Ca2+:H+ antiporter